MNAGLHSPSATTTHGDSEGLAFDKTSLMLPDGADADVAGMTTRQMEDDEELDLSSGPGPAAPIRVGRYFIIDRIGAGGMGVVYVAYDPELDRRVAVKLLLARRAASEIRIRLEREAKAMARLAHPNVVAIHDVGTMGTDIFIAMEYVDGETLRKWLIAGPRPWQETLDMFLQAGRGLAAAHEAGLIHRDFKPENVLVGSSDGRARVTDFGLARALGDDGLISDDGGLPNPSGESALSRPITRLGAIMGTPAYMAPEQHIGGPADARSDQFAFCVALYEALHRERPFPGETMREVYESIRDGVTIEGPARGKYPAWIRRALARGLSFDPKARWPSMQALLDELDPRPRTARRQRGFMAAALALAVTGLGAYGVNALADDATPCGAVSDALVGAWDEERSAAVERALLATEAPYAADAWTGVESRLGAYADGWLEMRREACRATHVERTQSEELLDLRAACLDRRREKLAALVEVLAAADASVAGNAVQAAERLPALSPCADVRSLRARVPPPADVDPNVLGELRKRLAAAEAHTHAGQYVQADAILGALVTDAEATGYRPLIGDVLMLAGDIHTERGDLDEAAASLREAYWHGEASRHDALAARAASLLIRAHEQRGDYPVAREWARHGEAIADRVALEDPERAKAWRASIDNQVAAVLSRAGEYPAALAAFERALAGYEGLAGDNGLSVAGIHNNIANVLTKQRKYDDAVHHFERAREAYRAALGQRHPLLAAVDNNLGDLHNERGTHDQAREHFTRARELLRESGGPETPNYAIAVHNLGVTALRLEEWRVAEGHFREALGVFERAFGPDSIHLAYPLNGLGEALLGAGDPNAAFGVFTRALALGDEGVPGTERANTRFGMARAVLLRDGEDRRERALGLAREARPLYAESGDWRLPDVDAMIQRLESPPSASTAPPRDPDGASP